MVTNTRSRIVGLALVLLAAACGQNAADPADSSTTTSEPTTSAATVETTTTSTTLPPTSSTTVGVPTLDDQVDWIVELLNGGTATEAETAERFNEAFLAQVSAAQFLEVVEQLRGQFSATWAVTERTSTGPMGIEVALDTEDGPWTMVVEIDEDGRIGTALFRPDASAEPTPADSFDEVVTNMAMFGDASFVAAEVVDGSCEVIHGAGAESVVPLGSTFKLYVLGAVATAVEAGQISWDDPLPIADDLKSLPGGIFQDLEAGTEKTVFEHALEMIRISDNTATDHLIHLVGRDAVEAQLATLGNSAPELNVPFLTTLDFFKLKLLLDDAGRDAYLALDAAARRDFLETDLAERAVTLADAASWTTPIAIRDLEWFATPLDQCRVLATLSGGGTDEVREILSFNPGVPIDPEVFPFVGFKGGSEPGVLNGAWILERADGRVFVVAANVSSDTMLIPESDAILAAAGAFALLADE